MDRANTQFWVAVLGMGGLVGITFTAILCAALGDFPDEMTYLLVGGLVSVTSTAAAWLFRLNGQAPR